MRGRAENCGGRGFTLIEVLASVALIATIMMIVVSMTGQLSDLWRGTAAKIEQFSEARAAFESLTRRLSQATLNTYWGYDDPAAPNGYVRLSDLRFVCQRGTGGWGSHEVFFHAPFGYSERYCGMNGLLNAWGYYVEYADDDVLKPSFVQTPAKRRFRLMEYMVPSEEVAAFGEGRNWAPPELGTRGGHAHMLAENVIALILWPRLSPQEDANGTGLAPQYEYNSSKDGPYGKDNLAFNTKNQLPPTVQVTLVAIDEASAGRMRENEADELKGKLEGLFWDASRFRADLNRKSSGGSNASLEAWLIAHKINYHIFTTNVVLRGAKWSRQ